MNSNYKIRTLVIRDLSMYFEDDVLNSYDSIDIVSPMRKLGLLGKIIRKVLTSFNIFLPYFIGP